MHILLETVKARSDANMRLKNVSQDTKQILDEFARTYKEQEREEVQVCTVRRENSIREPDDVVLGMNSLGRWEVKRNLTIITDLY